MPRAAAAALLIAALASPATAAAGDDHRALRLELEWHAPGGCLDREAARAAIEAALGESAAAPGGRTVARVRIAQLPDGRWNADIWMYGAHGSGERSFAGATCTRVAEAAALIVAMAIDSGAAERAAARETTPGAQPVAAATRFFAGVRAAGDVGSLPEPSAGAGVALGLEHGALRAELELIAWLPQIARSARTTGGRGHLGLFTAGLHGCFDALSGGAAGLQLGPCLGAEAGVATGRGEGVAEPETDRHLWAAALAGVAVRHAASSGLHLALRVEAGLPLRRATWEIENSAVFRASRVVGRASLAVAWLFP